MSKKNKNTTPSGRIAKIPIRGKDQKIWSELKGKLMTKLAQTVDNTLNSIIDPVEKTTLKEEINQFSHQLLGYAKAKLSEPGISNQKTIAEIETIYARRNREIAETRKIHAEADALEFDMAVKKLKLALGATKVFIACDKEDQETIIFIKQIEDFRLLLDSLSVSQ